MFVGTREHGQFQQENWTKKARKAKWVSKVIKQGTSMGKLREQANTCQFCTRKRNNGP